MPQRLFAIGHRIYLVDPSTGDYSEYDSGDWTSTTAATLMPTTQNVYLTTAFNNLWELSLTDRSSRKISWDGWGTCNALLTVPADGGQKNFNLFAFCHKLWLVDDPATGHCTDYLGGATDVWTRVNAAVVLGTRVFATTSANNLWRIDTTTRTVDKLGGGMDNWSTCRALVPVGNRLLAFCYGLWWVDPESGQSTRFFEDGDADASRSWSNVKSSTVIGECVYVLAGSRLVELNVRTRVVREVSTEAWLSTRAIVAVNVQLSAGTR